MNRAAIDCGTNAIRLLICDSSGKQVLRELRTVRLGEGVDKSGVFASSALQRTFDAAREFRELLNMHQVTDIKAIATSAVRDVVNRSLFISELERILGCQVDVISGIKEAQLAFSGAVNSLETSKIGNNSILVLDLGGGSTEFTFGKRGDEANVTCVSVNLGCVRLCERFEVKSRVTLKQQKSVAAVVREEFKLVSERIDLSSVKSIVGVAGTVTTVSCMVHSLSGYYPELIHGSRMTLQEIRSAAMSFARMNTDELLELPFMLPGRSDVIVVGALILSNLLEMITAYSPNSLLLDLVASEHDSLDALII